MRLQSTSLVVRGKWNVAILSPEWIVQNILQRGGEEVNVLVQLSGPPFVPVYIIEKIKYSITQARIELFPASWSAEDLLNVERIVSLIANTLPHTPVRGLGLNFNFIVDELDPSIVRKFDIDNEILDHLPERGAIKKTEIHKAVSLENCTLNMVQSLSADSTFSLRFNYHFEVKLIGSVAAILDGTRFVSTKGVTVEVIRRMLGVDAEDINEEGKSA